MVFVIAEIGVNWDGDFDLVKKMIRESKNAGCDAVKFQSYEEEMIKNHPQKSRLLKSAINKENIELIHLDLKLINKEGLDQNEQEYLENIQKKLETLKEGGYVGKPKHMW